MKVLQIFKDVIKYAFFSILLLILCLSLYNIYQKVINKNKLPDFFGYSICVVGSESMSPTMRVGDLYILKHGNTNEMDVDDIIVFDNKGGLVVHRIKYLTYDSGGNVSGYITKGDNPEINNLDASIGFDEVYGKVVKVIPGLTELYNFAFSAEFFLVALLILIIFIIMEIVKIDKKSQARLSYVPINIRDGIHINKIKKNSLIYEDFSQIVKSLKPYEEDCKNIEREEMELNMVSMLNGDYYLNSIANEIKNIKSKKRKKSKE